MDTAEIAVILGGMGLIALVLWFFFGAHEATRATTGAGEGQMVRGRLPARKSRDKNHELDQRNRAGAEASKR